MESSHNKVLFLDNVNSSAFIFLIRKRLPSKIILLDKPNKTQKLFIFVLNFLGYKISEANFFAGHLKLDNGESVYIAATNSARKIAEQAALEILETNPDINAINSLFGSNTLHLHLTKQLIWYVRRWTERIIVSQVLTENCNNQVCISYPNRINPKIISNAFPDTEILFYKPSAFSFFANLEKSKTILLELIRFVLFPFNGKRTNRIQISQVTGKPSVLLLQEDTLRSDTSLRGQPHWFDFENSKKGYNTFILKSSVDKTELDTETKFQFKKNQIFVLETTALKEAFIKMRHHDSLIPIRNSKRKLVKNIFFARGFKARYFTIRTALFLKQTEFMGAISLWLNVKVFLFRESYIPLTDAIQLASKSLGVKTIAYQYSNIGLYSPMMMNTADLMLVFSQQFEKILKSQFYSPAKFLEIGYLYTPFDNKIKERALAFRTDLFNKGAEFIICFFDESVQHDKWGLISTSDHLHELHVLAEAVLNDSGMGVVVKSQFLRNTPSRLYPNDSVILRAVSTGRFVELHTGLIRNDFFPLEAGLISDITIGHKFGATASLEVAIEGLRSVMLDNYGTKTIWDEFYDNEMITFSSMESLMDAIYRFRFNYENYQNLGDWSSFLCHLVNTRNYNSVDRIREIVEWKLSSSSD